MKFADSLRYALYVLIHPFDGFYCLKHERKGRFAVANLIIGLLFICNLVRIRFLGFIFNENDLKNVNFLIEACKVFIPFILWCIANFGITTLANGKGNMRDIYLATAYALLPMVLFSIPTVLLSRVTTLQEGTFITIIEAFALLWTIVLLLIGMMTIHDYSMSMNLFTILATLLGMAAIMLLALLFISLLQQMYNFIYMVVRELIL